MGTTQETRREANEKVDRKRGQKLVLQVLESSPNGMTPNEIAQALQWDVTRVRPRVSELKKEGAIQETGDRRRTPMGGTAAVFEISPPAETTQKGLFDDCAASN